ncbi:MAG: phasin family protein [Salinibacter sp.]|uniref:phasin family protein n=1 Tax=Salinibacter sp. TaxID=2065818 RepID=UPI002FC2A622
MSDNGPTITVTRGTRTERSRQKQSSSARSRSSGWGLPGPGAVVAGVVGSVRAVWWAGLGAAATVRDAGAQVFDALVEEGKSWEQAERKRREQRARQVRTVTEERDALGEAEERLRGEVNTALRRVGLPSRDEVEELREEIGALADRVERLARTVDEHDG